MRDRIEVPELFDGGGDRTPDRRWVGYVHSEREIRHTVGDVQSRYLPLLSLQGSGDRLPEPGSGSGYEGDSRGRAARFHLYIEYT
jgi:hypothetical protein